MASVFATLAVHWAGRTNRFADQFWTELKEHHVQKLYYQTTTTFLPDRQVIAPSPISCEIEVSRYFQEKIKAFRQHTSQAPLFDNFEQHLRKRSDHEYFHLAATNNVARCAMETDLFAGIED
jgi:LmbE family N-acetylglucosaminyl deacetylase